MTPEPPAPKPISVRGGVGGIEARYEDLRRVAGLFRTAAIDMAAQCAELHGYLLQPAPIALAPFDPGGATHFESELLGAIDGEKGLTALAARCATVAERVEFAAVRYQCSDDLRQLDDYVRGFGAAATLPIGLATGSGVAQYLTTHPDLVDSFEAALALGNVPFVAGLANELFDDGRPDVKQLGIDRAVDRAGPPRSLYDVVADLERRNLGRDGEIDVRVLNRADGSRAVIVDLPGTKDWSMRGHNGNVNNLGTNVAAIANRKTTYEQGVIEALRMTGVGPQDPIMLVGHSQGGMVAAATARDLDGSDEFHVAAVVTLGAPIGAMRLPRSTPVLAVENDGDLVPHLDARANRDEPNLTTITLHRNQHDVGTNHHLLESYLPGSADVDASQDVSVRAFRHDISHFLDADLVSTNAYRITRAFP